MFHQNHRYLETSLNFPSEGTVQIAEGFHGQLQDLGQRLATGTRQHHDTRMGSLMTMKQKKVIVIDTNDDYEGW